MSILEFLDYLAIAFFAATGALSASRKQLDIIGHYSQNNPAGYDSLLTFIDHTERYNIEDNQTLPQK